MYGELNEKIGFDGDTRNARRRKANKFIKNKKEKSEKERLSLKRKLSKERKKPDEIKSDEKIKEIDEELGSLQNKSWFRIRHHRHCCMCNGAKYSEKNRKKDYDKEKFDFCVYDYQRVKKRNLLK